MDDFNRNNWIVLVTIMTAGALFTSNIFMFNGMLSGVADHIDKVVNNTGQNMTLLTSVLIEAQKQDTNETINAVQNFTEIMAQYSNANNENLDNISSLLASDECSVVVLYEDPNNASNTTARTQVC